MRDSRQEPVTLSEIRSLEAAIAILDSASRETCNGPFPIWQKILHARTMLEDRMSELITPQVLKLELTSAKA